MGSMFGAETTVVIVLLCQTPGLRAVMSVLRDGCQRFYNSNKVGPAMSCLNLSVVLVLKNISLFRR